MCIRDSVCSIRNSLLGALFFGNVLVGGDPSAAFHRVVHKTNDPPIMQLHDLVEDLFLVSSGQNFSHIFLSIIGAVTANCYTMVEELFKATARSHDLLRQIVHFNVLLVADDKSGR